MVERWVPSQRGAQRYPDNSSTAPDIASLIRATAPIHSLHLLRPPERLQRLAVVLVVRLHELSELRRIQIDHAEAAPVRVFLELRAVPNLLDRCRVLPGNR